RRYTCVQPAGWLSRQPEWAIPERHLGLVTSDDVAGHAFDIDQLAAALEETVNVDLLLELSACPDLHGPLALPTRNRCQRRIAVARDAAFCFYYEDNLDLLRAAGAEIVSFSPLCDAGLPENVDLVYLGGGYPELHAERLAANRPLLDCLRHFHRQG